MVFVTTVIHFWTKMVYVSGLIEFTVLKCNAIEKGHRNEKSKVWYNHFLGLIYPKTKRIFQLNGIFKTSMDF